MIERIEISILLDFYGELLTSKQRDIMGLYFNEDFSLAEISELTDTSRQAIHDVIKRCHKILLDYESKLELMDKSLKLKKLKDSILKDITLLKENIDREDLYDIVSKIEREFIENI